MKRTKVTRKAWSYEEDKYLRNNSHKQHYKDIATHLGRPLGSVSKRVRILGLSSDESRSLNRLEKNGYGRDVLEQIAKESFSVMEVVRKLGKTGCGPTYKIVLKAIDRYGIDCSHFDPWKGNRTRVTTKKKPVSDYLTYGSNVSSSHLKEKLYKAGLKQRQCEKCGQGEIWNGEHLSLVLDHVDGDPKNNRLDNLRIVCPNCNATLPTHCRGKKAFLPKKSRAIDIQREINGGRTDLEIASSIRQRRVERPSRDVLLREVKEFGFAGVGRKYGVSDNSIRKWLKNSI